MAGFPVALPGVAERETLWVLVGDARKTGYPAVIPEQRREDLRQRNIKLYGRIGEISSSVDKVLIKLQPSNAHKRSAEFVSIYWQCDRVADTEMAGIFL